MKTRLAVALFAYVAIAPCGAGAQQVPWLQGSRAGEGIGIRVDDLELHPGVAAQVGYDSNLLQVTSGDCEGLRPRDSTLGAECPEVDPMAFWRFKLTPHLYLSTLGAKRGGGAPPTVTFRGGLSGTANLQVPATRDPSAKTAAREQRDISVSASFKLDILPQRPWGGDMYAQFERATEPSNSISDVASWDRDALVFGTGVIWRPSGGVFDWRLGYELRWNHFEKSSFRNLDNFQHTLSTRNRWKFLPRTALMHMTELGFIDYAIRDQVFANSTTVRTRLGLNGLVTNRFGLLALLGWGSSFYDAGFGPERDFDSVIAQGQATWFIMSQGSLPEDSVLAGLSSVAAGYSRQFMNNYLSAWYQVDRVYVQANYAIASRITLSAESGYGYYTLPPVYWNDPDDGVEGYVLRHPRRERNWHQGRFNLTAFAEYALMDTVALNITARYSANLQRKDNIVFVGRTDPVDPGQRSMEQYDDLSFRRFELYFGARWFM